MAKPAYRVYTVLRREKADDFWLNIGLAFPHEAGADQGLNILLQAMPLDGKLVLRKWTEKDEEQDEADKKAPPPNVKKFNR